MIRKLVVPAYVVATLFPRLLSLPYPLHQVQLTEILFLVAIYCFRKELWSACRDFPVFFSAAALYIGANLLSGIWAASAGSMLEAGARAYLVVLVAVVVAYIRAFGLEKLAGVWMYSTVVVAVAGLAYYGLIMMGVPDVVNWVQKFAEYPYFGEVLRLRATAATYGMWVMLLLPGLLLAVQASLRRTAAWWPAAIILLAAIPTFSKEILLIIAGILLLSRVPRSWRNIGAGALFVLLWTGTHYLLKPSRADLSTDPYTTGKVVLTAEHWQVVESVYVPIKRVAMQVGWDNFWLGVGPGEFTRISASAAPAISLPPDFGSFDPHSAWTGAFAETGILGLLGLIALIASLIHYRPQQWTVAAVVLLLFLVASVFKDVMNFRGLWVMVGLYVAGGRGLTGAK